MNESMNAAEVGKTPDVVRGLKAIPFLWFAGNVRQAMEFYTSILPDSQIVSHQPGADGAWQSGTFTITGQTYMAFDGGPMFSFSPAMSLFVQCQTQEQVDLLWDRLARGGTHGRCGWLTDQFGFSWQVVPEALGRLLGQGDQDAAGRVQEAMMQMTKLEISVLEAASTGRP